MVGLLRVWSKNKNRLLHTQKYDKCYQYWSGTNPILTSAEPARAVRSQIVRLLPDIPAPHLVQLKFSCLQLFAVVAKSAGRARPARRCGHLKISVASEEHHYHPPATFEQLNKARLIELPTRPREREVSSIVSSSPGSIGQPTHAVFFAADLGRTADTASF